VKSTRPGTQLKLCVDVLACGWSNRFTFAGLVCGWTVHCAFRRREPSPKREISMSISRLSSPQVKRPSTTFWSSRPTDDASCHVYVP
jgi:hypothetical protein